MTSKFYLQGLFTCYLKTKDQQHFIYYYLFLSVEPVSGARELTLLYCTVSTVLTQNQLDNPPESFVFDTLVSKFGCTAGISLTVGQAGAGACQFDMVRV